MRIAIVALASSLLVGCGGGPPSPKADHLAAALELVRRQGPGATIRLDSVAAGPWQRVFVFGPYTTPGRIERCLGGPMPTDLGRGIESRDDVNLLVFAYAASAPQSVALPRSAGDFGPEAVDQVYAREEATFVVRAVPAGSWGELVPARNLTERCS